MITVDGGAYAKAGVYGRDEAVQQAIDAAIIGQKAGLGASADILVGLGRFPEEVGVSSVGVFEFVAIAMFGEMFMTLGCTHSSSFGLDSLSGLSMHEKQTHFVGSHTHSSYIVQ